MPLRSLANTRGCLPNPLQPVLRTISMTVRGLSRHLELSEEAESILSCYDTEEWVLNASKHVHSQYAADWRPNQDLDSIRLDSESPACSSQRRRFC